MLRASRLRPSAAPADGRARARGEHRGRRPILPRSSALEAVAPDPQAARHPMMSEAGAAILLFSGGQDSTTCLGWALQRFARVETIGFDYGQRHRAELEARPAILDAIRRDFPAWSGRLGDDHLIDLAVLGQMSETSL